MAILVNNTLVKVFFKIIDLHVLHASLASCKLKFETFELESWLRTICMCACFSVVGMVPCLVLVLICV